MNLLFVLCLQILFMLRGKMLTLFFHSEMGSGHAPFLGTVQRANIWSFTQLRLD